jgi:hypothetical protein
MGIVGATPLSGISRKFFRNWQVSYEQCFLSQDAFVLEIPARGVEVRAVGPSSNWQKNHLFWDSILPSTAVCSGFHSTVVNCNEQLLVLWAPVKKKEAGRGGGDTVGGKLLWKKTQ